MSAKRIPSDADLQFIEATRSGAVHIRVLYQPWHEEGQPTESIKFGEGALAAFFSTPLITRCGQRTFPGTGPDVQHRTIGRFSDERLCGACYRTLHPDDQERAFDHEQPDAAGDEGHRAWSAA